MNTPNNNFDLLENIIPYKIVKLKSDCKFYVMVSLYKNYETPFGQHILFPIDKTLDSSYEGNEIYETLPSLEINDLSEYFIYDGSSALEETLIPIDESDFEDLSEIKIKDIENINYFIFKNEALSDETFDEDELKALNQTFMKIIIEHSDKYNNVKTPAEFLYKSVIDFYANGQYDDATVLMNTIFNTPITVSTINNGCNCSSTSSCSTSASTSGSNSINTGTSSVPVDTATCIEKYTASMYQWLIKMLSDTDFYCNWMSLDLDNDVIELMFNDVLIDKLIDLLTQFLNLGFDLSNLNGRTNCSDGCNCGHTLRYRNGKTSNANDSNCSDLLNNISNINGGLSAACSNYKIIQNYINVLKWVKNNEINENKNKIYIYGKQFAEIFPLLNF